MTTFDFQFDTPSYKGKTSIPTGIFIDNEFLPPTNGTTIEYVLDFVCREICPPNHFNSVINPATARIITSVAEGVATDVDRAVAIARRAFNTTWGRNKPGSERGVLLMKLADLIEEIVPELAALVSLENGAYSKLSILFMRCSVKGRQASRTRLPSWRPAPSPHS